MGRESGPKKKATKKQKIIAGLFVAGIAIGVLFVAIFVMEKVVGFPERDDWGFTLFLTIPTGVMLGGIYGLMILLSNLWNVEFDMFGFKS